MKLFKFCLYGLAFIIGLSIAFCSNTNYDQPRQDYELADSNIHPISKSINGTAKPKSPDFSKGKILFKTNCASCHNRNMIDNITGPALRGTVKRWQGREDLLKEWIRNSQKVIASGDTYAVNLYNKYNKSVMTAFPNLSDDDIKALLVYIETKN